MKIRREWPIALRLGLLLTAGCSDPAMEPAICEVAWHAEQPVDEPAQYLDFVLTRTAPDSEGRAVRMVTWDDRGQIIGAAETTVEGGSYRFELDEGYERFYYQWYVVSVDTDGDGACGAGDAVYRAITSAWNPVDNAAYIDEGPRFANPAASDEDCAAVDRCIVSARYTRRTR